MAPRFQVIDHARHHCVTANMPDVVDYRNSRWRPPKPEMEINRPTERNELTTPTFVGYRSLFRQPLFRQPSFRQPLFRQPPPPPYTWRVRSRSTERRKIDKEFSVGVRIPLMSEILLTESNETPQHILIMSLSFNSSCSAFLSHVRTQTVTFTAFLFAYASI